MGHYPKVTVIGIEFKDIYCEMGLFSELAAKISQVFALIKAEIGYSK